MKRALSFTFHVLLPNLALVAGLVLLVRNNLAPLAFGLLVLSKWQILLGGRKVWLRNIRDNGCDLVVAVSAIAALILFTSDPNLQIVIASLYALWLIVLKPLSGSVWVGIQAAICQFSGLSMLFLLGRTMPEFVVILLAWVIGLVSADHLLSPHHDPARPLIAAVWGLIVAELSWLLWRWLVLYSLFNGRLLVPQAPLIITIVGYGLGSMYIDHAAKRLRKRRLWEYLAIILVLLVIIVVGTDWDTRI